jgi:hypothetical protein
MIKKKSLSLFAFFIFISSNLLLAQAYNYSYVTMDTVKVMEDTMDFSLLFYTPHNADISFTMTRPDSSDKSISLSVAGAFTAQNLRDVVGNYIEKSIVKENKRDKETGFCAIIGEKVVIKEINDSMDYYYNLAQKANGCYFQQMLLLNDGKTIPCTIFRYQKPTHRRALAIYNGKAMVVESVNRMNVEDFTLAMKKAGIKNAIYLDMGSWSEGFIRNKENEKIAIGHLKQNTRYQSNWIEYKTKPLKIKESRVLVKKR